MTKAFSFYKCIVYDKDILRRCADEKSHIHAGNREKNRFDNVKPPAIVFLQYKNNIIAYGEFTKIWVDEENDEKLEGWIKHLKVNGWYWKDNGDHTKGVGIGENVNNNTEEGLGQRTIKKMYPVWGLAKMKEINPNTDLVQRVESELKKIQDMEKVNEYAALLKSNHNLILTGAPGTGKTYLAKDIAKKMKAETEFVQFHPSYDYTDFVEGLRPINKDGNVGFERQDGIFKQFCKKAKKNKEKKYVFIIDEINRGDISKIFGELFFSIDPGYRGEEGKVKTQYQNLIAEDDVFGEGFFVPKNVYIIGTMNDIDRSVESMDFAMRRRFVWKEIVAKDNVGMLDKLGSDVKEEAIKRMNSLNAAIENTAGLSTAYHIGASYFLKLALYKKYPDKWTALWENHIKGVLYEYLRGNEDVDGAMKTLEAAYNLRGE